MKSFRPTKFNNLKELRDQFNTFLKENQGRAPAIMELTPEQFQDLKVVEFCRSKTFHKF